MSWTVQHSRVHRSIGSRWLIYSTILIFLLALFAFLLPTSYSMDLLGTLSTWFYALLDGLRFLISLILLPFILFINWLMSLFRSPQAPEAAPPIVPPPLTLNGPLIQGDWFELLKSSLFWITLVGMIGFSAYFFLKENRELFGNLQRFPILRSIAGFLSRAIRWIQNGFRRVTAGVSASISLVRKPSRQATESSGPRFFNPRRMDYRRQVIFYYLAMLRRAAEHGVPRSASQTPAEYSARLAKALESSELAALTPSKDFDTDVTSLTDEFNKARYSRQSTSREDAGLARESWNHIRRMIQALLPTRRMK
jgi:hypothetical protein